jgi:hypothetical protein
MQFKIKLYLYGLGAFLAIFCIILATYLSFAPRPLKPKQIITTASQASAPQVYTNSKGLGWKVASTSDFTVASAKGDPIQFLEGKIDPLSVHPGQTQHMRLVIMAESGISGVTAEIETDHGTTTVPLHKTGTMKVADLDPRLFAYVVDDNNKLQILSPAEALAYRQKAIAAETGTTGISSAQAASGEREVWEGSWVVKDTSVRTYITNFIATDTIGHKDNITLAWSDPCSNWSVGTDVTTSGGSNGSCSVSSTFGIDGSNLTISVGDTLTLAAPFYMNSGKTIKLTRNSNGNSYITFSGGFIGFSNVYYIDADQDGYAAGTAGLATVATSSGTPDGNDYLQINGVWTRRGKATTTSSIVTATSAVNGNTYTSQALAPSPKTVAALNQDTRPSLWQFLVPAAHALLPMACTGDSGYPCYRSYSGCAACGSYTTSGTTAVVTASSAFTSKAVLYSGFNFSSSTTPYIPPYAKITGISVTLNITKSVSTSGAKAYALIAYNDPTNGWTVVNDSTSSSETYTGIDSSGTFNATIGSTSSYLWDAYFGADSGTGPIYGPRFGVYTMVSSPSAATININSVSINVGYSIVGLKTAVDCADGDARANPGQAGYFTTPIQWFGVDATTTAEYTGGAAAVSSHYYDFNCSNSTDKGLATSIGSCGTGARNDQGPLWALVNTAYAMPYNPSGSTSASTAGWSTAAPGCGSSGSYFYYCVSNSPVYSTLTMMCK